MSLPEQPAAFLARLYDLSKGDITRWFKEQDEIGGPLGFDPQTTRSTVIYLIRKGFLQPVNAPHVALTTAGIDAAHAQRTETSRQDSRSYRNITITGSTVNFGDGASINITNVTVGDILGRLEGEITSKVTDPEQRRTLLTRLRELVGHPAFAGILQVALPEILKRLSNAAGNALPV